MFEFMEDYTMIAVVAVVLLIAGGYYFYSRSRSSAKHVDFDVSQDESVSSKDEYVCDGDTCSKKE